MNIKLQIFAALVGLVINLSASLNTKPLAQPVKNKSTIAETTFPEGILYCAPVYESVTIKDKKLNSIKIPAPKNGDYQLMWENKRVTLNRGNVKIDGRKITTIGSFAGSGSNLKDEGAKRYKVDNLLTKEQLENRLTCALVSFKTNPGKDDVIMQVMGNPEQIIAKYETLAIYKGSGDSMDMKNYYTIIGDKNGITSITDSSAK
jgi:hypothetical protein